MPVRVWLDTDVGTDVDDAVAIVLALLSPEIELVGISTVYGDVALRSRMVLKLLQHAGRRDVPVYSGCGHPLMRERPVFWAGWEGEGLLGPEDQAMVLEERHAVDALCEAIRSEPEGLTLVTIGPLTNAALALAKEPALARRLHQVVVMGGVCRCGPDGLAMRFNEHNVTCDPEAASIVFRCGAPIVMVGLDVTTKVFISAEDARAMRDCGDPLRLALADQLERYLRANNRQKTPMHDPLALSHVVRPGFLRLQPCEVLVETRSEVATGATWVRYREGSNTQVAVDVEAAGFEGFLRSTLCS